MRGNDRSNQFNDEDYCAGGPCPSCRLAINKETGRLKWCMGGNNTWRLRIRLMLLIPALLLPITIIFIAICKSNAMENTRSLKKTDKVEEPAIIQDRAASVNATGAALDYDPDLRSEIERKGLLDEIETSYVPQTGVAFSMGRRKRDVAFGGDNRWHGSRPDDGDSDKLVEKNTDTPEDGGENSLADYSDGGDDDDQGAIYENGEVDGDDYPDGEFMYADTAGNSANQMPWHTVNSGDKEDRESDEAEEREDPSDFHAFWKGEGDLKSIREAQAKMMLRYMDESADPCNDFYQYACGNWAKRNPIPKDKAGYDTFEMLRESLDSVLKELLEEPIHPGSSTNSIDATVKAKHLYQSCMNYEILERRVERPLIELLDELGGWPILRPDWDPAKFDWLLLVAQLRLYNNDILISEWVGPDIRNSDQYVIQFDQTSLGLPTRDYFLRPSNSLYLEAYKSYLIKIATLLGAPLESATRHADELIDFETKLAEITSSPDERRNVSQLYQRMSIGELRTVVPQIDWRRYLSIVLARPADASEPVVVFALQYIQDLVNLLSRTPSRTISNYLLWRFVRHRVNNLDDRFQEAKQRFYYILFGREQAPLRWKNCVAQVNSNMGMAVGSMFVRKYFDENSKNDTLTMTQEIQQSFRELLTRTSWIDDETKRLASEKVDAMLLRIGYPDFILQRELLDQRYMDVVISPDKYFENTLNILQHLTRVEQDRLGSPVNKTLWNTAPAVVNAYYSRNKNQIMFPAGILQPPFYHRYFPRSLNYGGIGVVIGHEITHGFDDKGRLFDKDGNLHRWWKDRAIEGFHRRAQCLIDQYGRYTVPEVGMRIDGTNTQGENIADNGGIKQAFRAYQRWLSANGEADETLPGITASGKQLFFLNFAQVWCGSMRPEATRNKLKTAVHSPGKFRVIGTLSNSDDFAKVFDCPAGTPMNPVNKCSVW